MSEADLAAVWARSLDELATMHIEPHQRAWLKLTRPLGLVENTALIATPNEFVKEQLETRLRALITHALSRELGRSIQLAVTVDPIATAMGTFPPAAAGGDGSQLPADGAGHGGGPHSAGDGNGQPEPGRGPVPGSLAPAEADGGRGTITPGPATARTPEATRRPVQPARGPAPPARPRPGSTPSTPSRRS